MTVTTIDVKARLRYVIHLGLVEIRSLAMLGGQDQQISKLADVLEFLPRQLEDDVDLDADLYIIIEQFEQYKTEFPEARYDYIGYLTGTREIFDY
jgi:hypothetical protein